MLVGICASVGRFSETYRNWKSVTDCGGLLCSSNDLFLKIRKTTMGGGRETPHQPLKETCLKP